MRKRGRRDLASREVRSLEQFKLGVMYDRGQGVEKTATRLVSHGSRAGPCPRKIQIEDAPPVKLRRKPSWIKYTPECEEDDAS